MPSPWEFIILPRVRGCDAMRDKPSPIRYVAPWTSITTTEELAAACERLAQHPFVTVDTEFLRETTYYPLLCVAQMASPTRPWWSTRWRPASISSRSST